MLLTLRWVVLGALALLVAPDEYKKDDPLIVAEVGGERVEVDESFGRDVPGTSVYAPQTACKIVSARVRDTLVRQILRRAGRLPPEEEITQSLERHLPDREVLERRFETANREQNDLADALIRSEVDPTRDHEIWQGSVSEYMTYEKWVAYRTQMKGRQPSLAPFPAKVSRADLLTAARGLRPLVLEEKFQAWVQTEWAYENPEKTNSTSTAGGVSGRGVPSPWTESLQLRFWRLELERTPVSIAPAWQCPKIVPTDLLARKPKWPDIPK
jgi:hypothetical protein